MPKIELIQGDCFERMKEIPDNSVDAIVTDPPYGLSFMGKEWDKGVPGVHFWQEMIRVLKPGGYLLSFSGTRTYHRMATAIEDGGFEIRDMIEWVYGSGFPKSLNIGKAVDKINGEMGRSYKFTKWLREDAEMRISDLYVHLLDKAKNEATAKAMAQHYISDKQQPAIPTAEIWGRIRPHIKTEIPQWVDELVERIEREREVVGKNTNCGTEKSSGESMFGIGAVGKEVNITKGTSEWEGWGTALKPAHEPICMARKPLAEKTVAENVLKHGTGGINVDGSRVGTDGGTTRSHQAPYSESGWRTGHAIEELNLGRFPANLIHDNSEEVRACFPDAGKGNGKGAYNYAGREYDNKDTSMFNGDKPQAPSNFNDSGNASRFFKSIIYQAKASKRDRGEGNIHPTVKSVALMEYLINMVTKEGGTVLDPFIGSGTTGVACKNLGRDFIGIEMDSLYCDIAKKRIEDTVVEKGLFDE